MSAFGPPSGKTRFFSHSELTTFRNCRRRWYVSFFLRYERRLDPKMIVGPFPLGIRVHAALEELYARSPDTALPAALRALDALRVDELDELRDAIAYDEAFDLTKKEVDRQHELAVIMVRGYHNWLEETGADHNLRTREVEAVLETEMQPSIDHPYTRVVMRGKADLVVEDQFEGSLYLLDHKTCANLNDEVTVLWQQMRIYAWLWNTTHAEFECIQGAIYNRLKKNKQTSRAKPPFYKRERIHFNTPELAQLAQIVGQQIDDALRLEAMLRAGADPRIVAYPSPSQSCSWACPHFKTQLCPAMNDPKTDYAYILENEYVRYNPDERYDPIEEDDASTQTLQGT